MNDKIPKLYLNFKRYHRRLEKKLVDIRTVHGKKLLPGWDESGSLLDYFIQTVFVENFPADYYLSNTSLSEQVVYLTIRPINTGISNDLFPPGLTICVRGSLSPKQNPSPEILVDRIIDIADSEKRDFELAVTAIPNLAAQYRDNNLITPNLIRQLPEISKTTRENLQNWNEYLDWKQEIVEDRLAGLRYVKLDLIEKNLRFTIVAKDEPSFQEFWRSLKNEDLLAFPLRYSTGQWTLFYQKTGPFISGTALGQFRKMERLTEKQFPGRLDELPWKKPFLAFLTFGYNQNYQGEVSAASPDHHQKTSSAILSKYPVEGWLAVSVVGDLALINRQRQALKNLEIESGYAPFLSSWLFDIHKANLPQITSPVDKWLMKDINEGQKKAVKKMISAPDIALIQGPPGTGKTTVIGEAVYQLVHQGKRVVLASQANLAVDNALEKLANVPEIRAIRLGRSHRFSAEGQQFAEDKVLKKFYSSISEYSENHYVNKWQESDTRLEAAQKQLEDLESLESALHALSSEIRGLENRKTAVKNNDNDKNKRQCAIISLKENLTCFVQFLAGKEDADLNIPDKLLDLIWSTIISGINQLKKYRIDLNPYWLQKNASITAEDKSLFFKEIYKEWRKVSAKIPRLREEIERLNLTETNLSQAPEDRMQFNRLNRQLQIIEDALQKGDDAQLNKWRELRGEIKGLEKKFPLDKELYATFFNMEDNGTPFYLRLINPNLDPKKRLTVLNFTLTALENTEKRISKDVQLLIENIQRIISSLTLPENQEISLKDKEVQLKQLNLSESKLRETYQLHQEKIKERLKHLEEEKPLREKQPGDKIRQIKKGLERQMGDLKSERQTEEPFRKQWEQFMQDWVKLLTDPEQIANDNQYFMETYLENCNVVGITCNENPRLLEGKKQIHFDVAIIDEVSKATPPEMLLPMMMAKKTILVGDQRQLPPLFKERKGAWLETIEQEGGKDTQKGLLTAENYYKFKDMVTASLFKQYFDNAPGAIKGTLLSQYRMHPEIMEIVNHFYDYRLECGLKDPDKERNHNLRISGSDGLELITPQHHALWIDSSRDPLSRPHYEAQKNTSKANVLEAILIIEMLKKINEACASLGYGDNTRKPIGVISFYDGQVNEIRRRVRLEKFPALDIDINTVDQFQGKEKPIVLVSLVRNTRTGVQSNKSFVAQFERINVAFSRAQELLIIFGACQMFAPCQVELPLLDSPSFTQRKVYDEIITELNRRSALWKSGRLISGDLYPLKS